MTEEDQQALWQNERYVYGFGWQKPGLLERANWSDAEGQPLAQSVPYPSVEVPQDWQVQVTHATDAEGWQYGSVFKHLEYDRPGGRASHRTTDFVRRRCWTQDSAAAAATCQQDQVHGAHAAYLGGREGDAVRVAVAAGKLQARSLLSPATHMHGSRLRKHAESDRRMGAFRAFLSMLASTFRRRTLWNLVPMDPAAWLVMLRSHQAQLQQDQAQQLAIAHAHLPVGKDHQDAEGQNHDRQDLFTQRNRPEDMRALIRRLTCAAMHSRAAYGYAMAAGHLSSLLNFALLQTVQQVSFNAAGGASGQANNEAVAAMTGIPAQDLYMAEWHNSIMRPCHYLALHRSYGCLVLAIRGSLEVGDVLSDLKAEPMDIHLLGRHGKVHEGIMSAATYVHCNTAGALQQAAHEHPGTPLLITGHSMGGSVGAVLALLLRGEEGTPKELGPVHCVAMAPAPPLTQPLASACDPFVTSVVLGADVVPRLSYASVEGAFLDLVNSSPVRNAATSFGRKVTQAFEGLKVDLKTALHPPHWTDPFAGISRGLADAAALGSDPEAAAAAVRAASRAAASLPSSSPCQSRTSSPAKDAHIIENAAHHAAQADPANQPADPATTASHASSSPTAQHRAASTEQTASRAQALDASRQAAKPGFIVMHRKRKLPSSESHPLAAQSISPSAAPLLGDESSPPQPHTHPPGYETEQEKQRAGEGATGAADRAAAAEAATGRDSQGEHPEPLYLPGRVLWIVPDREVAAAEASATEASGGEAAKDVSAPVQADVEAWLSDALRDSAAEQPDSTLHAAEAAFEVQDSSNASEGAPSAAHASEHEPDRHAQPAVLQVDRAVFERILLTADMVSDHLPDAYLEIIRQL